MKEDMKAIDWAKIQEIIAKLPALAAALLQIIEIFKQPQPARSLGHCPSADLHCCLCDQQKALVEALVHNAHMQECCCPDEEVTT